MKEECHEEGFHEGGSVKSLCHEGGAMKGGFHERGFRGRGCHKGSPPSSGQQAGGIHCYHYFSAFLFSTTFSLKIHSSFVFALSYKDAIFRSNLSTQQTKTIQLTPLFFII